LPPFAVPGVVSISWIHLTWSHRMQCLTLVAALASCVSAPAQTCRFVSFGSPCGGDLFGQHVPSQSALVFHGLNLAPFAFAVLVAAPQLQPGAQLPGSNCLLLVPPTFMSSAVTDAAGACSFVFTAPTRLQFGVDLQIVTLGFFRNGRTAESTNGLNIRCR